MPGPCVQCFTVLPGPPSGALACSWQVAVGQWGFSHATWKLACVCDVVGLWMSHVSYSSSLDQLQFWSCLCLRAFMFFHGWVPQTGTFFFPTPFCERALLVWGEVGIWMPGPFTMGISRYFRRASPSLHQRKCAHR